MKYLQKHLEFFEKYHNGSVNIIIHFLGFIFYGYGIGSRNLIIIIIAPLVFECGHWYNYVKGIRTKYDKTMIPVQILTWFVCIGIAFAILEI